ncbi:MAG TPA: pseudaminic acid biosynthesis-associated methylase [Gemmatimonadales bacterium]|jgi:pseudaminic acid biosynthesis-associated methylase
MKNTRQMETWSGTFGREYTDRNTMSPEELDALYRRELGVERSTMNQTFLGELPRELRVLEVGSNIGNQLLLLRSMGFNRLYGIELQRYAVQLSKPRVRGAHFMQGSAFNLPCRDGAFDLVFTSGVLIHLAPADLEVALGEIHRASRRYIWGMEYFSEMGEEIAYRGRQGLLWKADFCKLYLERFPDLRVVRQQRYPRRDGANQDIMFLLERAG